MSFFEQRFPDTIAQGARGGPRWKTEKTTVSSGHRTVNARWTAPLHYYNVGQGIRHNADFEVVRAFFFVVFGAYDGFRFKDFADFETRGAGVLTLVSGSIYQLGKAYTVGSRNFVRTISKPVAGLQLFRTRGGSTTNITGASTIDLTTGRVTVAGHADGDAYTWSGEFDVPVAFVDDSMEVEWIGSADNLLMDWGSIMLEEIRVRP